MANSRKQEFFKRHPVCCFCGGEKPSTTEDHQPARTFFTERKWPEGYSFPACHDCNSSTKKDEQIMSFYALVGRTTNKEELKKKIGEMKNNYPQILKEIIEQGLVYEVDYKGICHPVISINFENIAQHATSVGAKLGLALHYMHSNTVVPKDGGVIVKIITNYNEISNLSIRVRPESLRLPA